MSVSLLRPFLYIKRGATGSGGTSCALATVLGSGLGTFAVNVPAGAVRWFAHDWPGDAITYNYTSYASGGGTSGYLSIYSADCATLQAGPANPATFPAGDSRIKVDNSTGGSAITSIVVS